MPCGKVPGTRLSTPPPAPGRPPAAATLIRPGGNLERNVEKNMIAAMVKNKLHTTSISILTLCILILYSLLSPVSGSIKFWVNSSCLHAGPLRGCHQIFLINTVLQTVRYTPLSRENRPLLFHTKFSDYPILTHTSYVSI